MIDIKIMDIGDMCDIGRDFNSKWGLVWPVHEISRLDEAKQAMGLVKLVNFDIF